MEQSIAECHHQSANKTDLLLWHCSFVEEFKADAAAEKAGELIHPAGSAADASVRLEESDKVQSETISSC